MKIKIATTHSENADREKGKAIDIELQGGSPLFGYIWIDDSLYQITKGRNYSIKKLK
jgi:hypothetical protein